MTGHMWLCRTCQTPCSVDDPFCGEDCARLSRNPETLAKLRAADTENAVPLILEENQ